MLDFGFQTALGSWVYGFVSNYIQRWLLGDGNDLSFSHHSPQIPTCS